MKNFTKFISICIVALFFAAFLSVAAEAYDTYHRLEAQRVR